MGQDRPVESKLFRQTAEIVKILHSAVRHAELDHRFTFLGDDRFPRVRGQHRCWKVQQRGIFNLDGSRCDDVTEANVDLDGYPDVA